MQGQTLLQHPLQWIERKIDAHFLYLGVFSPRGRPHTPSRPAPAERAVFGCVRCAEAMLEREGPARTLLVSASGRFRLALLPGLTEPSVPSRSRF